MCILNAMSDDELVNLGHMVTLPIGAGSLQVWSLRNRACSPHA
jgi:hypothetical protein